jgi:hypothetical protein
MSPESSGIIVEEYSTCSECTVPPSSNTPTPTPTITITPTITSSVTPTNTVTPTITPTSGLELSLTPTPSPTQTPTPFEGCVEPTTIEVTTMCCDYDPQLKELYFGYYDGWSDMIRFYNGPTNFTLYAFNGSTLSTHLNYDNDVSFATPIVASSGQYGISYTGACHGGSNNIIWMGNQSIGTEATSPFLYAPTGQEICNPNNELIFLLYNIGQTSISSGAPLVVGSQLYQIGPRGGYINVYRAGSYLLPNGNKYNVNSIGIVESIEVGACDSAFLKPSIDNKFKTIKNPTDIRSTRQYLTGVQLRSVQTLTEGNCYKFMGLDGKWVSGELITKTSTGFLTYDLVINKITCG